MFPLRDHDSRESGGVSAKLTKDTSSRKPAGLAPRCRAARQYGITAPLLFRWKQELAPPAQAETIFLPVTITDAPEQSAETPPSLPGPVPVIVERSAPGIEVELIGGRRVRFERDTDPETVRRLVTVLEGEVR